MDIIGLWCNAFQAIATCHSDGSLCAVGPEFIIILVLLADVNVL